MDELNPWQERLQHRQFDVHEIGVFQGSDENRQHDFTTIQYSAFKLRLESKCVVKLDFLKGLYVHRFDKPDMESSLFHASCQQLNSSEEDFVLVPFEASGNDFFTLLGHEIS